MLKFNPDVVCYNAAGGNALHCLPEKQDTKFSFY